MHINATLIGQMLTFMFFIWFTMKYIWPPVTKALDDRQGKIADGLAAAERGHRELELAQQRAKENIRDAKIKAGEIIDQANQRAHHIVEESKDRARTEGQRLIEVAKAEIDKERETARFELQQRVATIAVAGAERILKHQIDAAANNDLLNDLVKEL